MTPTERAWRDKHFGHFLNDGLQGRPCGYRCDKYGLHKPHWWSAQVPLYHFKLDPVSPVTWVLGDEPARLLNVPIGSMQQPPEAYDSDYGSVPSPLWWIYSPERFLIWLIEHDPAYLFHYVWLQKPGDEKFQKHAVSRWQADKLMEYGIGAEDGDATDRGLILAGVRIGGGPVWQLHG